MDDLLILVALTLWVGLWATRELGWFGIRRGQASAAARRRSPRPRLVPEGGPDGPLADAVATRP